MEFASRGVGAAGLTTGIIGTAGVGLNLLGNLMGVNGRGVGCYEGVNHNELFMNQRIGDLEAQIALRDANIYGDQKLLEVYKYTEEQLKQIRETLCAQAVHNQKTEDSFHMVHHDLDAVRRELLCKIEQEAKERCCSDNAIVNYSNATFYPKMVADVTTGTTTTAQLLYNPIPDCGCGCGRGN